MIESKGDKKRLQVAIVSLWQLHNPKGAELPIETQRAYLMALQDLEVSDVETACVRAMQVCKFFPKPVELRDLAGHSLDSKIQIAWGFLQDALRVYGQVDAVSFGDRVLAVTIRQMGGLRLIANMKPGELSSFGYHRFKEIYTAMVVHDLGTIQTTFRTSLEIPKIKGVPVREQRVAAIGCSTALIGDESQQPSAAAKRIEIKRP